MRTIINLEELLIVSPYFTYAELEEVPAPHRSPEAPGGPEDETRDDDEGGDEGYDGNDWKDEDEDEEDEKPDVAGGFEFPSKPDPMM